MLYIPKTDDYLKILSGEEVKDFVTIHSQQNPRKVPKSLYIFLTTPDEVEKYMQSNSSDNFIHRYNVEIMNIFDPELELIITKHKLKELLSDFKKFKSQALLVLDYKKRKDHKIFHSSTILIASNSDIDEAFKTTYQSIMTKIRNYACEDWIALDVIIKHSFKIFGCQYKENKQHKKMEKTRKS